MDPKFSFPPHHGKPLLAVSPERANRQPLPLSPSLPSEITRLRDPFTSVHTKTSSEVQVKVAQFNNLSKEAIQRRKDNEAALKRAIMGREEAESETRRLKEENRLLRKEVEEGRGRERRVAERVEGVMEELQRTKETSAHSQAVYEKEVRRARKEAFKSSSALVKTQEELKSARNRFTLMREEAEEQRRKVHAQEQNTFSAQYQLVGLQEEIETLAQQKKVIEEERDALTRSLKVEEIARIAAEGRIALPVSKEGDEFASPEKKSRQKVRRESFKENMDPLSLKEQEEITALKYEISREKRFRYKAEDQIHFMKMECQFKCCSCRIAERQGVEFIHDGVLAEKVAPTTSIPLGASSAEEESDPFFQPTSTHSAPSPFLQEDLEPLMRFSPRTGTFYKTPSPLKQTTTNQPSASPKTPAYHLPTSPATPSPDRPSTPSPQPRASTQQSLTTSTPFPGPLPIPPYGGSTTQTHTIKTITTTIPLVTTPLPAAKLPFNPEATMTREQALEQIRARRGRARSIAAGQGTPRRLMVVGLERRDISAPAKSAGQ